MLGTEVWVTDCGSHDGASSLLCLQNGLHHHSCIVSLPSQVLAIQRFVGTLKININKVYFSYFLKSFFYTSENRAIWNGKCNILFIFLILFRLPASMGKERILPNSLYLYVGIVCIIQCQLVMMEGEGGKGGPLLTMQV